MFALIKSGVVVATNKDGFGNAVLSAGDEIVENSSAAIGLCYSNGVFSESVAKCRTEKRAYIRKECGHKIDAGFFSEALGYECQYRNTRDRQNEMFVASVSGGGEIWRNETLTQHTVAQAKLVLAKSRTEVARHNRTYADKCVYINNPSRTAAEINAVTWDSSE